MVLKIYTIQKLIGKENTDSELSYALWELSSSNIWNILNIKYFWEWILIMEKLKADFMNPSVEVMESLFCPVANS